jgi:hypothetical protein
MWCLRDLPVTCAFAVAPRLAGAPQARRGELSGAPLARHGELSGAPLPTRPWVLIFSAPMPLSLLATGAYRRP